MVAPARTGGGRLAAVALLGALSLGGCSSLFGPSEEEQAAALAAPARCPKVAVLREASEATQFRQGGGRDLTDVVSRAAVLDFRGGCRPGEGQVEVDFQLVLAAERGPAFDGRDAGYQYFVAVTDPDGQVLAKQVFDATLRFEEGQSRVGSVEDLHQRIPVAQGRRAQDYQVLVGFQLTPEQLEFNRSDRAF